jgi:molybdopterin molybdotransferase
MIELEKALALAGKHPIPLGKEKVDLQVAMGRVLAEDVFSDRDVPAFPRATMDGYACKQEDLPGPLEVLETVQAGKLPTRKVRKGECSRIMTGAVVPEGADCVVMQELVKTGNGGQVIFTGSDTDRNIDPQGQDLKEGDLLLQKGTRLTPGHSGILASIGMIRVNVLRDLRIGVLATGSELIEPEQRPEGAQIRNSNSNQLAAQVSRAGHTPLNMGIVEDDPIILTDRIKEALEQADLLLLTGGASVGEFDLVPGVLEELGFHLEYNRVAIQPGKPVSFAHRNGKVCFGLSGNPVSSFVQFEMLVRPFLEVCTGEIPVNKRIPVRMENDYQRKHTDRLLFLPIFFTERGTCEALDYHGSGHLHALHKTIGFAEIPAGQPVIKRGDFVYVRLV